MRNIARSLNARFDFTIRNYNWLYESERKMSPKMFNQLSLLNLDSIITNEKRYYETFSIFPFFPLDMSRPKSVCLT